MTSEPWCANILVLFSDRKVTRPAREDRTEEPRSTGVSTSVRDLEGPGHERIITGRLPKKFLNAFLFHLSMIYIVVNKSIPSPRYD